MKVFIALLSCIMFACASQPKISMVPPSSGEKIVSEAPDPIECEEDDYEIPVTDEDGLPPGILVGECVYRQITANQARLKTLKTEVRLLQSTREREIEYYRKAEEQISKELEEGLLESVKFEAGFLSGIALALLTLYGVDETTN